MILKSNVNEFFPIMSLKCWTIHDFVITLTQKIVIRYWGRGPNFIYSISGNIFYDIRKSGYKNGLSKITLNEWTYVLIEN